MEPQLGLPFHRDGRHGGRRPGAGRKRAVKRTTMPRTRRPRLRNLPVHVTLRVLHDVPHLRHRQRHQIVRATLRRCSSKERFRICHYSIQGNHLHLLCEAATERDLARGVQGFASSLARRINRTLGRRGRVFSDRYHARALRSPREVRHALMYILNNWRHHEADRGTWWRTDPFSSADAFDGWTCGPVAPPDRQAGPAPVASPTHYLLTTLWKLHHPLVDPREVPVGDD